MTPPNNSLVDTGQRDIDAGNAQESASPAYRYSLLPPRHIRLLQILEIGDKISCELKSFPLGLCPSYHALSYAWGSGILSHRVHIGGNQHHFITEHLHQGLVSIRRTLNPSWLWIDQICINQADSDDKAAQVALMGEIYTTAIQTIVWLGPAYQKSDLAMSHVKPFAGTIRKSDFSTSLATTSAIELGLPHEDQQVWPAFQYLFRRPWWQRLWIVQEAIKAKDIVFVAGSQMASYDDLMVLASAHERYIQLVPDGTYKLGILSGLSKAFYTLRNEVLVNISHFRSGMYSSVDGEPNNSNIERLLGNVQVVTEFSRYQHCTEPVDRVYAILGLVGDQVRSMIKVDYSDENRREYWRTYLDFYRHLIHIFVGASYLFTTVLAGRHTVNTPKSLPSWCPDLNRPEHANHPYPTTEGAGNIPPSISWKPDYRTMEPCNSNSRILHVTGIQVDTIKSMIPLWSAPRPVQFDKFTCRNATDVKTSLQACFEIAQTVAKSSEDFSWTDALFRTLVMNTRAFSNDMYPAETLGSDCLAFIDRLTAIIDRQHHGTELEVTEVSEAASRFASSFFEFTRNRALFVTEQGRLGLCDAAAMPGDEVVVWFEFMFPVIQRVVPGVGGCKPFTAKLDDVNTIHNFVDLKADTWLPGRFAGERREQRHRRLLGLCYVDGLMRGEIFSGRDMGKEGYSNFLIV